MNGKFGIDFIFRDMKTALGTLKIYNDILGTNPDRKCWPAIYASKLPSVEDDEYYVYLDPFKKRMHISAYPVDNSPFNGRRIVLPNPNNTVPSIEDVKSMCGV